MTAYKKKFVLGTVLAAVIIGDAAFARRDYRERIEEYKERQRTRIKKREKRGLGDQAADFLAAAERLSGVKRKELEGLEDLEKEGKKQVKRACIDIEKKGFKAALKNFARRILGCLGKRL